MQAPVDEILPGFKNVREKGLNLVDASQLHHIGASLNAGTEVVAAGNS
jgi:hypothetical protein